MRRPRVYIDTSVIGGCLDEEFAESFAPRGGGTMKNKSFDAVEMKNAIQAKRRRERADMSDEQVRRSIAHRLDRSDDPLRASGVSLRRTG
jgi:hypothetical protein